MNLKFITPKLHGFLDYTAAIALIVMPFLLSLKEHSIFVAWFSIGTGVGLALYSLLTDYQFSLLKLLPYKFHLLLDGLASVAFLLVAVLHEGTLVSKVYCLTMGMGVIAVILLSQKQARMPATL
ncbi:hypothetical protein [Microbulbifer sp. TYP-18]|uniref:hypothetical protein n=1 Tax=Microbulbifer sp. TYP-18 TaxID=3230024 RepID=UPI0034C64F96